MSLGIRYRGAGGTLSDQNGHRTSRGPNTLKQAKTKGFGPHFRASTSRELGFLRDSGDTVTFDTVLNFATEQTKRQDRLLDDSVTIESPLPALLQWRVGRSRVSGLPLNRIGLPLCDSGLQGRSALTNTACVTPSTGPIPNRDNSVAVTVLVISSRRLGSCASIAVRSIEPWQNNRRRIASRSCGARLLSRVPLECRQTQRSLNRIGP